MWFTHRRTNKTVTIPVIGVIALLLASCGFRPLYKSGGGEAALSSVQIDVIKDRMGQQLRSMLIDRFSPRGKAPRADYRLSVALTESKAGLAIKKDETATRANLTIAAKFKLVAIRNSQLGSFTGEAFSTNSYNILTSDFATLSAERDARDRALRSLAEEIRLRVASALKNPRAFSAPDSAKGRR